MRPRQRFNFCLIVMLMVVTSACQLFFEPEPKNNPESNFETVWNDFNEFYAAFGPRGVDWDSVYRVYRPQVNSKTTELALFSIISNMFDVLRDGHVTLNTKFGRKQYQVSNDGYPKNFLGIEFVQPRTVAGFTMSSFQNVIYGFLQDNIGYIYIKSFAGNGSEYLIIDQAIKEFQGAKGIIVDVRSNGGGAPVNADIIANRFADQRRIGQYFRWRRDGGRNNLSDYEPSYVNPDGPIQFTKEVVILTNRESYSAAEYFIGHMKSLPQVTQIGGTSGGGSGVAYTRDLPNGWTITVPRTLGYSHKKELVEWVGFAPDSIVTISKDDIANGYDRILQAAIDKIKQ